MMFAREIWPMLLLTILVAHSEAYKILCLFPYEGKSHFIMFEAMCKSLAVHGHQVDIISPHPTKMLPKNYRHVLDLSNTYEKILKNVTVGLATTVRDDNIYYVVKYFGNGLCELLGHKKMQQFIRNLPNESPYDVVLAEIFSADCYFGFGHYLNVPVIGVSTGPIPIWIDYFIRNPLSSAFTTNLLYRNLQPFDLLNFWDRFNSFYSNLKLINFYVQETAIQTELLRKHLNPNIPNIINLRQNLALILVNTHYSIFGIKPNLPSIIEIGGMHIEVNEDTLTSELKKWMDESTTGVVYFSFGSLIPIETLKNETFHDMIASFVKISPIRVLMRVKEQHLLPIDKLPNNIKALPWIPQIPVLRHNNTRAFITHGGLMGIMEALYYEVPMIGIPMFWDQTTNVHTCALKNIMIHLPFDTLNEKTLDTALHEILENPKYKNAAKEVSRRFRDRPLNAINTTIFWVEYIIRNGANSLISPAINLHWYQVELLDVYAFVLAVIVGILLVCQRLLKIFFQSRLQNAKKKRE